MHRPNAAELESLTEAFRRDPGSPAFVSLGEALIALGRPRDAVEIGARGLRVNPQNLYGRLMVARAFATLHQWKEAQAELLKVVKTDRNSAAGFRLLGEVLLRRGDFERAVPVLQHAQNLAPADPSILELLRRARGGQPLDPPPPIPTPMAPGAPAPPRPAGLAAPPMLGGEEFEDIPTRVAGEAYSAEVARMGRPAGPAPHPGHAALGRVPLDQIEVRGPLPPAERPVRRSDGRGQERVEPRPLEMHRPPPAENPLAPIGAQRSQPPQQRSKRPSAPVGPDGQLVRPRVVSARRSEQAARESLRQSAAVGEMYLNNLLTAGLLDLPNVRVGELTFDVNPDRRWGRSSARMFIYLFVIGAMAIGGVGTWYWYSEKQRSEDVNRHLEVAESLVPAGDYASLDKALVEVRDALRRDPSSLLAIARYAEAGGLNTLLYGEIPAGEVSRAIDAIKTEVTDPGDEGYREILIARAAVTLARLDEMEAEEPVKALAAITEAIRGWLEKSPDDRLVRWLEGRALLAAGARTKARAALEKAWAGGEGSVLAAVDLGDMTLDDGKSDEAMELYNAALEKSENHPLALVGRSLLRAEESRERQQLMKDISIGLEQVRGVRVGAYKQLALAMTRYFFEDYGDFATHLEKAVNVSEPRFLARVALARILAGDLEKAGEVRDRIRWYANEPEPHPLVTQVNAEIHWHTGDARAALETIGDAPGVRAGWLRGRAHFALGDFKQAREELNQVLEKAPDDLMLQVWTHAARLAAPADAAEASRAREELERLGRAAKTKAARYPYGIALIALGRTAAAREELEASLEELTAEQPNPLEYRAQVALAGLDVAAGKIGDAAPRLQRATEINPGYLPALDLYGQLLVGSDATQARDFLRPVIEAEAASAGAELAWARALLPVQTPEDLAAASAALERAKAKGASDEALRAIIEQVDSKLFDKLGVEKN
jgi:tetratricopeptide (TPR) repeat protein